MDKDAQRESHAVRRNPGKLHAGSGRRAAGGRKKTVTSCAEPAAGMNPDT